ncbi:aldehyde dehydrogenase family protein [Bacillus velezensis]|nr:aldehyde dehydrogenase family protein [Bacillus velezensis]MCT6680811.1 aldehyde dehydrogenase family protein [Bacillus velezensis]
MDQHIKADIKRVFALQKKNQKTLRASTAGQRREKLQRFLDAVTAHEEEIIEAIRRDVRKPYHEDGAETSSCPAGGCKENLLAHIPLLPNLQ